LSTAVQYTLLLLLPLLVVLGAASDALTMTIPDRLPLALVGSALALAPIAGLEWTTLALHCTAAAIVLAVGFAMFAGGWIGGGDAKFAAAIVLWLGWDQIAAFAAASAIFGGVLAAAVLILRRTGSGVAPQSSSQVPWMHDTSCGMPFGLALAAAALTVYPDSVWIKLAVNWA